MTLVQFRNYNDNNILDSMRGSDGSSPLHLAAALGSTKIVELFLATYRLNPNVTNTKNQTPLFEASIRGTMLIQSL